MKILLIFPRIDHGITTYKDKNRWTSIIIGSPAITLPHIAALTPKKHLVEIIDENFDNINFEKNVDLIGISCLTMTAPRVYEIADEFRRRGKTVILGGYHASALPNEAKQHADSVVIGEAELTWPRLLSDFEKGQLEPFYRPDSEFNMSIIPPIRRDLIKHMPITGGVQSTRGCNNRCEFCAITSFYDHRVKQRPIKNVVEEIKQMPNKLFLLHDPSLTSNQKYARELFKALIREKVKKGWFANGNVNVLAKIDDEFLKLARRSGCIEWFVGFESVRQESLDETKKNCNRVNDFKSMVKRVHEHDMAVQGGIIFGFDNDTPDIFDKTLETVNELGLDLLEVNILTPFPGTPLFERLEKEKRLLTKDWSKYNQVDVVFKPKNMSEKELYDGARKVAKEFYNVPNIVSRFIRTMMVVKNYLGFMPAFTNFSYRRYYKRDFCF
jgi:radical SAM superfamily enzyme YgiQ (UPF0313 family)